MEYNRSAKTTIDKIPKSLPLLNYVNKLFSLKQTRPFVGCKILAIQHLLGSTIPFFTILEKAGVNPTDLHIVGKAYSSHPLVVRELQQKGYRITFDDVFDFREDKPYDSILEKHIDNSILNLLETIDEYKKGLIIDDGGKAITLLNQKYRPFAARFACVEQTSRGIRVIRRLKLMCPVINVARSEAKTRIESPIIAKTMVNKFVRSLKRWRNANVFRLVDKKLLIIGYGFIGENVAKELRDLRFNVSIYDLDKYKLEKARKARFQCYSNLDEALKTTFVVIGCSGRQVMNNRNFQKLKPGSLLINMASTDTEFSAWNLRVKGKIIHQNVLNSDKKYLRQFMPLSWRSLYKIKIKKTYFYLANGGFPIDFSGKINPVLVKDIQFTTALLLGGAIQALKATNPELIDLDSRFQKNIIQEYLKLK